MRDELDQNFDSFEDGDYVENTTEAVGFVPLEPLESAKRTAAFVVISGRAFGQSFTLNHEECQIGRGMECTIRLDDEGISRRHVKVVHTEGQWVMMDLGSTNGTYHGGERIQVMTLYDGAKVQLGMSTVLRFQHQDVMDERFVRSMYESKTRDALTETYNKAYFLESVEREVAFALRHQQDLTLVMFDLDHFKKVNDTYGHQAGDLTLKMVAKAVNKCIRREDILARYGGEEFALLLRNTHPEKGFILAERIRRAVERLEIVHEGRRIPCTVSLGIESTLNGYREASALIEAADAQLYRAKHGGRNRTEAPLFEENTDR